MFIKNIIYFKKKQVYLLTIFFYIVFYYGFYIWSKFFGLVFLIYYFVNIKFVNSPHWKNLEEEFMSSVMGGDVIADIVNVVNPWHYPSLSAKNAIYSMDKIMDLEDFYSMYPPYIEAWYEALKNYDVGGNQCYGFPIVSKFGNCIVINEDIFKKENLPDPHQLIAENKWTWEKFIEIAEQATKDTNGDGKTDQWGIGNIVWPGFIDWLVNNNANFIERQDNKFVVTAGDKFLETLRFMQEIMKRGLDKTTSPSPNIITKNDVAMDYIPVGKIGEELRKKVNIDLLPLPKGSNGNEYKSTMAFNWVRVIPVTTKHDPQVLMDIMGRLWPPKTYKSKFESLKATADDKEDYKFYNNIGKEYKLVSFPWYTWDAFKVIQKPVIQELKKGEVSPSQLLKKYTPKIEAKVNDKYKSYTK